MPEKVGKKTILKDEVYEYDCPYFELGNTLDVFPDPEARVLEDGLGVFWVTMMSPHTVESWKGQPGYKNIEMATKAKGDQDAIGGSPKAENTRSLVEWHKNERIKVARYFGKIPKHTLTTWNKQDDVHDTTKETEETEQVEAIVIMAGGVVVKVDANPYVAGHLPVLRCVYEDVEHEIWGVGIGENNAPHQKVTNAAFRLFMEGKGMALLGTATVDKSKFLPGEDFKKFPGKVYQTKPGLTPDERKEAIIHHVEPDITGGWLDVIEMSERFSDDDTGITKYTQGNDSSGLNKTAHGISMIMSASSLPIKEVISNIDEMWIVRMVKDLIEWNVKYLEVETVEKIHGKEDAAIWAQIKEFGKTSFMDWKATGTSSFMQKEVLVGKIRAFSEFAMANPITAPLIDARELLNQTWDAMEVGRESPILKEDGEVPPQVQQQMQELQMAKEELEHALGVASQEHEALELEVKNKAGIEKEKLDEEAARVKFEAEQKRLLLAQQQAHAERLALQQLNAAAVEAERDRNLKIALAKIAAEQAEKLADKNHANAAQLADKSHAEAERVRQATPEPATGKTPAGRKADKEADSSASAEIKELLKLMTKPKTKTAKKDPATGAWTVTES
jgi:hypothetical protein